MGLSGSGGIDRTPSSLQAAADRWCRYADRGEHGCGSAASQYRADRIAEAIVEALIPLITRFAARLATREVSRDELTAAGKTAVVAALARYEPRWRTSFHTFAHTAVRGGMLNYLREFGGSNVREPAYLAEIRRKVRLAEERLIERGTKDVSPERLAKEAGVPLRRVLTVLWSAPHVARTLRFGPDCLHGEIDPDRHPACGVDWTENADRRILLETYLPRLPDVQQRVIRRRYFDGETLDEIGNDLGLSRERIRQIETAALRRLRDWLD